MLQYLPRAEIIPGLWVGSIRDAKNEKFLQKIGLIVRCMPPSDSAVPNNIPCYVIPVLDRREDSSLMLKYFDEAVKQIDSALLDGKNVLIHCYAGIQRSCAVAAAYLMHMHMQCSDPNPISAQQAMSLVKRQKPCAFFPFPTFKQALHAYEWKLQQQPGWRSHSRRSCVVRNNYRSR